MLPYPKILNNLKKKRLSLIHKETQKVYDLIETNGYIGRDKNLFIRISNKEVSKKHCEILFSQEGFYIKDNDSVNGTFIYFPPGIELYLKEGVLIMIGTFIYEFKGIKEGTVEILQYTEDLDKADKSYRFTLFNNKLTIGKSPIADLKVENDESIKDIHAVLIWRESMMIIQGNNEGYSIFNNNILYYSIEYGLN